MCKKYREKSYSKSCGIVSNRSLGLDWMTFQLKLFYEAYMLASWGCVFAIIMG